MGHIGEDNTCFRYLRRSMIQRPVQWREQPRATSAIDVALQTVLPRGKLVGRDTVRRLWAGQVHLAGLLSAQCSCAK